MTQMDNILEYAKQKNLYIHKNVASGFALAKTEDVTIYFMEGISHSYHVFKKLNNANSWFFVQLGWHHDKELLRNSIEFFEQVSGLTRDRLIVLANSPIELSHCLSLGLLHSQLIPHNCWLDYDLYSPIKIEKIYDLVINCRPENWKRPFLAQDVDRLAIIKGANHRPSDYYDLQQLEPMYINPGRLSPKEVARVISTSFCGGIFSAIEGACYSSSEYLLTGVPVVSTRSLGGRDMWYTERNSVVVEANAVAVKKAVLQLKKGLMEGDLSSKEIRSDHIGLSNYYREKFVSLLSIICSEYGLDAEKIFTENYRNKMMRYESVDAE